MATLMAMTSCGGGNEPSPPVPVAPLPPPVSLPAQINITSAARAEPGAALALTSNLGAVSDGLSFAWDFGDGQTSTLAAPSHAYTSAGDYNVSLAVRNSAAQSVSGTTRVQVGRFGMVAERLCSGAQNTGWCWMNPLPSAELVNGVTFNSPLLGVVGGMWGYLELTSNGGQTWARLPRTGFHVLDATMVDARHGWARSTDKVSVMHTADGGLTWQRRAFATSTELPFGNELTRLVAVDARRALVEVRSCNIRLCAVFGLLTQDSGLTWTAANEPGTRVLANGSYWSGQAQRGTFGSTLPDWTWFRNKDFGATATELAALPACTPKVDAVDEQRLWAWCRAGTAGFAAGPPVLTSADGGQSWVNVGAVMPAVASAEWRFSDVALDGNGEGFGVLHDDTAGAPRVHLLRASQGARRWQPLVLPALLASVALPLNPVLDSRTMWLVGSDAQAQFTDDGGVTWQGLNNPAQSERPQRLTRDGGGALLAEYFTGFTPTGNGQLSYVEAPTRRFYRSSDRGRSWQRVPGGLDLGELFATVSGIWFFDGKRGLSLMSDGSLRDTDDGGRSWRRRAADGVAVPCCTFSGQLSFTTPSKGWLIDRGRLKQSSDGGAAWALATVPAAMVALVDLQFLSEAQGWAVSATGQLFTTRNGGLSWAPSAQPAGLVKLVRFANDKVGVVFVNDGIFYDSVWHTSDGGLSWRATNFANHAGEGVTALRYADAQNVWMIGRERSKERIWRSSDGGAGWRAGSVPVTVGLYAMQFVDAKRGWLLGEAGTLMATVDGGETWLVQASGFAGNLDAASSGSPGPGSMFWLDAATGWVGGSNGALLATATGGK